MRVPVFISVAIVMFLSIGCMEKTDLEKPVTEILFPAQGDTLFTDEELRLVATLDDNGSLNQYRLSLVGNDERNGLIADSAISRVFVDNLAEDEFYIERVFDIPDTLMNGHYHLTMSALDLAGNQSEADSVEFFFKNRNDTIQPTFLDTAVFDTITADRGGLMVNVDVLDDELVYCKLTVTHENGTVMQVNEWLDVYYNLVIVQQWIPYDESWEEGNITYNVVAVDKYGYSEYTNSVYFDQ